MYFRCKYNIFFNYFQIFMQEISYICKEIMYIRIKIRLDGEVFWAQRA